MRRSLHPRAVRCSVLLSVLAFSTVLPCSLWGQGLRDGPEGELPLTVPRLDLVVPNLRVRYNPTEGTDLYLVWNESLNSDRFAPSPSLPLSQNRTLLVKYARTFTLAF